MKTEHPTSNVQHPTSSKGTEEKKHWLIVRAETADLGALPELESRIDNNLIGAMHELAKYPEATVERFRDLIAAHQEAERIVIRRRSQSYLKAA